MDVFVLDDAYGDFLSQGPLVVEQEEEVAEPPTYFGVWWRKFYDFFLAVWRKP